MPRINLSISDELFNALQNTANEKNVPINLLAINSLEKLYIKQSINYSDFLKRLIAEIDELPKGQDEFTLFDSPSYKTISMAKVVEGTIKPSTLRARVGKAFNELERTIGIKGVTRAYTKNKDGKDVLKFNHRAAVYTIDWKTRNNDRQNS